MKMFAEIDFMIQILTWTTQMMSGDCRQLLIGAMFRCNFILPLWQIVAVYAQSLSLDSTMVFQIPRQALGQWKLLTSFDGHYQKFENFDGVVTEGSIRDLLAYIVSQMMSTNRHSIIFYADASISLKPNLVNVTMSLI
ncbi:unnamed protein product [Caenorhabditis brenneri]